MSQIFVRLVARYAPIITFPVAVILGFIGYNIESSVSSKSTPYMDHSINEERELRLIKDKDSKEEHHASTIFDKNDPSKLKTNL